jgi:GDP-L-fucose synthase
MNEYNSSEHINVGSDVEITIKELSKIIKREVGYSGEIFWNTDKPNGTPRRKLDNTKLFDLGWKPKVSFDEGLARTIAWFKENRGRFL